MKSRRVTGEERRELAAEVRRLYENEHLTIVNVATKLEISYGKAYALLKESGARTRKRGRADR